MSLLAARDLSVTPPGAAAPAVRDVSLSVGPGDWISVTGPNGGGKTSLILGMAGLWPSSGELLFRGARFGPAAGPDHRRGMAVVLQDPSSQLLQPSVADELAFGLRNAGAPDAEIRRRVEVWSRAFDLESDLERDPTRLSAGRQQAVLLAAALVGEPEVLLADEATAHLDPDARRRALSILAERVAAGMALIAVTQIPDEIERGGRVLPIGSTPSRGPAAALEPRSSSHPQPMLRMKVAVRPPGEGPRVSNTRPLELTLGSKGAFGVVGRNGSGKSVLLASAAGMESQDQIDLDWVLPPQPPPIAALQFPELQVFEERPADEISYAAVARGATRSDALEQASNYLKELDFDPESLFSRRTWSLATGEKRIVEVVAALVAPACLHVLDEPTAGLDPDRRIALGRLVRRFVERRGSVLIATQDRDWIEGVAERVLDLDRGSEDLANSLA